MKHLALLSLMLVALGLSACRIGGGFDSEGRLRSQPVQAAALAKPENTGPAKPDTSNKTVAAALPAPVVYLIPAG